MSEQQSIQETLKVIRRALEDENNQENQNNENDILILNRLVNEDGTINIIENESLDKKETINILNKKLDEVFDKYFDKWLDKKIPKYLEKYLKNKKL